MSGHNTLQPPKLPLRLLRFFVKEEFVEEIEGDMEEVFQDNLERYSLRKARRLYWMEMFKLLRLSLLKNTQLLQYLTQYGMFKNYFKVSIRGLLKNPMSPSINIVGLSVSIGFCIFDFTNIKIPYTSPPFLRTAMVLSNSLAKLRDLWQRCCEMILHRSRKCVV